MNSSLLNLEAEGFTIEKGQFKDTTTVSGHTMLYQSFTAESVGVITFQGVSGVWYCDRSRRSFEFTLMVMQGEEERPSEVQSIQWFLHL